VVLTLQTGHSCTGEFLTLQTRLMFTTSFQGARSWPHNVIFSRLYNVMLDVFSTSLQRHLASWVPPSHRQPRSF
jgi:hypothetical protein